jgi:hypothetical protein
MTNENNGTNGDQNIEGQNGATPDNTNTNDQASVGGADTSQTGTESTSPAPSSESAAETSPSSTDTDVAAGITDAAAATIPASSEAAGSVSDAPSGVTVIFTGKTKKTVNVKVGDKLSDAIKAAGIKGTENTYRSAAGSELATGETITGPITVNVIEKKRQA